MAPSFKGAAELHRRQFHAFVDGANTEVEVRSAATRTAAATAADKVLGKKAVETGVGASTFIKAIWNSDINATTPNYTIPEQIAALGRAEKMDALLRVKLDEALITSDDTHGRTIFDAAKDVVYGGYRWTVSGTARTGLAPLGPYILWVAVKKVGES